MLDRHEPDNEFVKKLEWQIGSEARRRNRSAETPRGLLASPARVALSAIALMLVSMSFGAAAVAVSYQAEASWRQELLISGLEVRVELARQRLELAVEELAGIQRQVDVGAMSIEELRTGRGKLADAEAQLQLVELELEEIRLTGREPLGELWTPLVAGRDFVSERLRVEMSVLELQLELAGSRLQGAELRSSVGTASVGEVDLARAQALQVELAMEAIQKKLQIRQSFLAGEVPAVEAELRVLEVEAEQRYAALQPQLELASKERERVEELRRIGIANGVAVREAMLRVLEVGQEISEAEIELLLVRRQLEERRARR